MVMTVAMKAVAIAIALSMSILLVLQSRADVACVVTSLFLLCVAVAGLFNYGEEEPKFYFNKQNLMNQQLVNRMKQQPGYRPTFWCRNGHLQTLATSLLRNKLSHLELRREYLDMIDGGCVALDWGLENEHNEYHHYPERHQVKEVVLVILHGVFGGSDENYVRQLLHKATKLGWVVVIMNFRGAGTSLLKVSWT